MVRGQHINDPNMKKLEHKSGRRGKGYMEKLCHRHVWKGDHVHQPVTEVNLGCTGRERVEKTRGSELQFLSHCDCFQKHQIYLRVCALRTATVRKGPLTSIHLLREASHIARTLSIDAGVRNICVEIKTVKRLLRMASKTVCGDAELAKNYQREGQSSIL